MTGIALYELSFGTLIRGITALRHILQKASELPDAPSFPETRLTDDMKPLTFQVFVACKMGHVALQYYAGREIPVPASDERTLAELVARCDAILELLKSVDPKDLEGKEDETLSIVLGNPPRPTTKTGKELSLDFLLPNFFFHISVAYAILRMKGVQIGKMDYLSPFLSL